MKRLEKMAFSFEERKLSDLKELSHRTGVPQAIFVREALNYVLKKYRYLLTMELNPEETRYLFSRFRGAKEGVDEGAKENGFPYGKKRRPHLRFGREDQTIEDVLAILTRGREGTETLKDETGEGTKKSD